MKRSKFSLSHYKLFSCDMGELVPIGLTEVLPGDTFQHSTSALIRVSPLLAPVMHPVHARIHHWFVPHRLVWDNWEPFITGGPDGMNASVFPFRNIISEATEGSLYDYYGIAPSTTGHVSALPFRGYGLIWNEWYRDQDLQLPVIVAKTDGLDNTTIDGILNCGWEKDYFTTARPWTQKGPEVTIPFGATAEIISDPATDGNPTWNTPDGVLGFGARSGQTSVGWNTGTPQPSSAPATWADPKLLADLSTATAVSINELREAFAIQRYEEARARYGSRYTEYLRYLGVRSSDARLQRPEYLGGGKQTIQFSEVLATTNDADPSETTGTLKGHGIGAMRSNRYRRFFEEHGYVHSFLSVKPKTMYAQGLARTWSRETKEDFFQKELQHIGQQEVLNKEVFSMGGTPNGVFGYQDRYDEYRRMESSIAGEFRSTLDFWHYARIFSGQPALNADFVKSVPTKRVNAVTSADVLWIMANHSLQARRLVAPSGSSFIF